MVTAGYIFQGRYAIEQVLGSGGFGTVYLATDNRLNIKVAVKSNLLGDSSAQARFFQEAQLLAKLKHPNLPKVTDYFIEAQGPYTGHYFVMEYIQGENLHDKLQREGFLNEQVTLSIITPILHALQYLHQQNIIHRDIKPKNVLMTSEGHVFLVDFGITKDLSNTTKTLLGANACSSGYSPLEQYTLQGTDARSDLYSVGATMYSLITGETPPDAVDRLTHDNLIPISYFQAISPDIEKIINKLLAVQPKDRYQNATEVQNALKSLDKTQINPQIHINRPARKISTTAPIVTPPFNRGQSHIYDSPFRSPARALSDGATLSAAVSLFFPWLEVYRTTEFGFFDLIQWPTGGYELGCWITIVSIIALICLMFVNKRSSATRTALARWKMFLAIVAMSLALDMVFTEILIPEGNVKTLLGSWIMLFSGSAIIISAIADIKSFMLPKEAKEPGESKIIRLLHTFTIIATLLYGLWIIYTSVLSTNSYFIGAILGVFIIIVSITSLRLDDGLTPLQNPQNPIKTP
ncbi:MAG: hypothetical protein OHK0022_17770 [Roseiflexaceae bacterium]